MIAERIKFDPLLQPRFQTLTVLFANEAEANEFVARIGVFDVAPHAVTMIGVALGFPPKRLPSSAHVKPPHLARYTQKGIVLGTLVALFIGSILYSLNFLQLSWLEAILVYTIALLILGGVIGGAIGAVLASLQTQNDAITLPPQNTEGFLVTIKIPSHLRPQGESLARELGAKKVIS
ncbi:MAG: hypothetical protein JNM09_31225 [Blastocatellia bacterium]|nr:hypothetical protein [Blastocatellia bacterium]